MSARVATYGGAGDTWITSRILRQRDQDHREHRTQSLHRFFKQSVNSATTGTSKVEQTCNHKSSITLSQGGPRASANRNFSAEQANITHARHCTVGLFYYASLFRWCIADQYGRLFQFVHRAHGD